MTRSDLYDPRVAFDDVLGGDIDSDRTPTGMIEKVSMVLGVMRKRRLRHPPPIIIESAPIDTTEWSFAPSRKSILGADAGVVVGEFPLFDLLRARFRAAIGDPKLVRIDGEEAYAEFRDARRQSHLDDLDARLDRVSDETAAAETVAVAARGGRRVPLGLPPITRGKIECWLDGDEVLFSARTPRGILTTGAQVQPVIEELVGCAEAAGYSGADALLLGAALAPPVTGQRLLSDAARIAPALDGASVSLARPRADAGMAAAMALLQLCQRRDRRACREASEMANGEGEDFLREAADRLLSAQRNKVSA